MSYLSLAGQIPHFLKSYLSRPASALPKGAFWVVDFSDLTKVRSAILKTARLEPERWDITAGFNCLVDTEDYKLKGCLFCQAVSVPGEQAIVNPEGIQKSHFIRTATGDGRADYAPGGLKMVFLDTNVSFVDNVLRPWVVTTARLGMIARPIDSPDQYRGEIYVYKLGVLTHDQPPFVLQKYTFYGACPVEVSSEEYNYAPSTAPVNREATFVFHNYKLETNKNKAITSNTEQSVTKVGPLKSHSDVPTAILKRPELPKPPPPKKPVKPKSKPKPKPLTKPSKIKPPKSPARPTGPNPPKPKPPKPNPPARVNPPKPKPPKKDYSIRF